MDAAFMGLKEKRNTATKFMKNGFIRLPATRQQWSLLIMAVFYIAAGANHFRMPAFYLPLIPDYLPQKELLNILSGLAEVVLPILLFWPATRRWAAWGIIAMLLVFVPSHIWMIQKGGCLDPNGLCVPAWVMWVRLLLIHPLLLWWAYFFTKPVAKLA
jgi:uncharacterized membrane protein